MVKRFYQDIGRGKKVLDFKKILNEGFLNNIIISERGRQGKTFNCLELVNELYFKEGRKSVWLYNTIASWEKALPRFTAENRRLNPSKWEGVKVSKDGLSFGGELFCYFHSVSTPYLAKGSRDGTVRLIVYEEFNEGLINFKSLQTVYFTTIFDSFVNPHDDDNEQNLQVLFLSNNKTLAVPILSDLGITDISEELQTFVHLGQKATLVYVPQHDAKGHNPLQFAKNRSYLFNSLTGQLDRNFFNIADYENTDNCIDPSLYDEVRQKFSCFIKGKNHLFKVWLFGESRYFVELAKGQWSPPCWALKFNLVDTDIVYEPERVSLFRHLITTGRVFFSNFTIKVSFISSL